MNQKPSIVVVGPQGCGKTTNAERIKQHFGLGRIVDEGQLARVLAKGPKLEPFGVLYLTNAAPSAVKCNGAIVMDYIDVVKLANLPHGGKK